MNDLIVTVTQLIMGADYSIDLKTGWDWDYG